MNHIFGLLKLWNGYGRLTSVFWYAVTVINWVSGKKWVCRVLGSPVLQGPTSITLIRGWYLCIELTTICKIRRVQCYTNVI